MSQAVPDALKPVLARLRTDAATHINATRARIDVIKYQHRPFSHVVRVAVRGDDADAPACHLFAKVFKAAGTDVDAAAKRAKVERDFTTGRRVHHALAAHADLGAVRPVVCYPDLLAVVTEEAAGITLGEYLRREARWSWSAAASAQVQDTLGTLGRWVRAFQAIESSGPATPDSIREYVDVRLVRMIGLPGGRFSEQQRQRVLRHVGWLAAQVPAGEWGQVLVHSDLALGNVLVDGRRVVVLDFAMTKQGLALHDLARTSLQIELLAIKPHTRLRTVRVMQQALLQGYDPTLTTERPLFRLMTLLHRVNNLGSLSRRRTRFPESLYNWLVRRNHERWLATELARGEAS